MATMDAGMPAMPVGGGRGTAALLSIVGGVIGAIVLILILAAPDWVATLGVGQITSPVALSLFAVAALFMIAGGLLSLPRMGLGGAIALTGALLWLVGCMAAKNIGWLIAAPIILSFLGSLTGLIGNDRTESRRDAKLIYRQLPLTRITHWVWAVAMFFLLLSGLNIFNARPQLYLGQESGFEYDNTIFRIGSEAVDGKLVGYTQLLGVRIPTTGVLGTSGPEDNPQRKAFPSWATIPGYYDLGTSRVVHFFFAWILVGTLAAWLINALISGHLWRDIILKPRDIRGLPKDFMDHLRLRFEHGKSYSPLQKVAYFTVFIILFPLIILTGLTMSPGMDTAWPWLLDVFGGRQTARTIHFFTMVALVLFFIVHIIMVVLANPINELRSMITGYYRTNAPHDQAREDK